MLESYINNAAMKKQKLSNQKREFYIYGH